jgi:hypothetical protein
MGPKSNKCPIRERQRKMKHKRQDGPMKTEAGMGVMQPQVKEHLRPPETERGKEQMVPMKLSRKQTLHSP